MRHYEYYASLWMCGGCGYVFGSGEGRHWAGKKERARNRQQVRDEWPHLRKNREAIAALLELR